MTLDGLFDKENTQISFENLTTKKKLSALIPSFEIGQDIFILGLDVVLSGKVSNCFICGERTTEPYYGYSVDFSNGLHTITWNREINIKTFYTLSQAQNKANIMSKQFIKIKPSEIEYFDEVGFEYDRNSDNHKLTAGLAKVGKTQLYEHSFYCYHFLKEYDNEKKRDAQYKTMLQKMQAECERANGKQTVFMPITLYKLTNEVCASREYVEHNKKFKWE